MRYRTELTTLRENHYIIPRCHISPVRGQTSCCHQHRARPTNAAFLGRFMLPTKRRRDRRIFRVIIISDAEITCHGWNVGATNDGGALPTKCIERQRLLCATPTYRRSKQTATARNATGDETVTANLYATSVLQPLSTARCGYFRFILSINS